MASVGMSIDEFLNHSPGGNRGKYLSWRKREPPRIIVWLHPSVELVVRWVHNWPRVVSKQDRDTGENRLEVWGSNWVCHERELILRKQRYRDEHNVREYPPEKCPLCKMVEVVRRAVAMGEINWTEPVFRFAGSDADHEPRILTAGGIYNAFASKDLSGAQKAELRRAGISPKDAWQENAIAKCQYTFAVVDNGDLASGVQITDEAEALGNALRKCIRDKVDELGGGEQGLLRGNPLRNPYAFLWEYRPDENFDRKYRVVAQSSEVIKVTPELQEIFDSEPPDLTEHIKPGNIAMLRADMEKAALFDLPWDEIFGESDEADDRPTVQQSSSPATGKPSSVATDDFPPSYGHTPSVNSKPQPKPAPADEEFFACDHCEFDRLRATDAECPQCKTTYSEDGKMEARPCVSCKSLTPASGDNNRSICPVCAAIHDTETWIEVKRSTGATTRTRSRSQSTQITPPPANLPPSGEAPIPPSPPAATQRKAIGAGTGDKLPWGRK